MDSPLGLPEKLLLVVAGTLSLATGLLLYIFPTQTALYFAWTIKNPLTAVFLGASYLAGIGTFWVLRGGGTWREMRVQMPFMLAFGSLQLLATLLNLAAFDFGHLLAWAWLAVYLISAPLAWFVYIRNERRVVAEAALGTTENGPVAPVVVPAANTGLIILLLATLHIVVGLTLFVFPGPMIGVWPWGLSQLTAQVIGGWYIAGGISVWARLRSRGPVGAAVARTDRTGQIGQVAGFLVAPLLLIGAAMYRGYFSGPPLAVALYLTDVVLAGALLIYARVKAGRKQDVSVAGT